MKLQRQNKSDFSGGVQNKTTKRLALPNQLIHALNCEFSSKIGAITGRRGSNVESTVLADEEVLTILQWIKNDGTVHYFTSVDDGEASPKVDLYKNASVFGGAWSKSLEDLESATDIFGANFANMLIVANGVDAVKSYNGSTWSAVTNAPATGKFPEVYKQRLFILAENGFLHYSDVVNSAGTGFSSTEWLNRGINPNDGQKATMLVRHRGRLLIFKEESIYRYDGTNEPEAEIVVGTHSGKSVVVLGEVFFHHPTGIYKMGSGDPILISRAVQKYVDGMSSSNWSKVASGRDLENVYFWIGDVTIDDPHEHDYGKTYSDVVLVYNVYAESWTVFTGWDARTWFYDKTSGLTYFGTSDGKIVRINYNYADVDGETTNPISMEVLFQPEDRGYPEKKKEFHSVEVIGKFSGNVLIGKSYDDVKQEKALTDKKQVGITTCEELWIGFSESYSKVPPRIEEVVIDNVNLLSDAR
jgi:hypothetical protein